MNYKFTIGRRAKKSEKIANNYEIIDLDSYVACKPIVLILGGNGTDTDRKANGNAKIVSSMLGVFSDDVDVLSINYNQAKGDPKLSENCKELVQKLLIKYVNNNGCRLDIATACKNMRNITIFGHCFGAGGVMKRLIKILDTELTNLGYNLIERKQIISQIVFISYASNQNAQIDCVKGVYCLSLNDEALLSNARHLAKVFFNNIDQISMSSYDRSFFNQINLCKSANDIWLQLIELLKQKRRVFNFKYENNIRVFAYNLSNQQRNEHEIINLFRDDECRPYKNASSVGDCVSKCLACALCNAVANSLQNNYNQHYIEFDMDYLQQQIEDICKHHNYYQSKLDDQNYEL